MSELSRNSACPDEGKVVCGFDPLFQVVFFLLFSSFFFPLFRKGSSEEGTKKGT